MTSILRKAHAQILCLILFFSDTILIVTLPNQFVFLCLKKFPFYREEKTLTITT